MAETRGTDANPLTYEEFMAQVPEEDRPYIAAALDLILQGCEDIHRRRAAQNKKATPIGVGMAPVPQTVR